MKIIRLLVAAAVLIVYLGMCPTANSQTDYWIHTNGPGTGYDVRSLAVDSTGHVYAGTWTDGSIWKTTDNGQSWLKCAGYPYQNPVLGMTTKRDQVFASVYERGVYRSTDHGASWVLKNNGLANLGVRGILRDKAGFLWVGSEQGLFCSTDDGESWISKHTGLFGGALQDSTGAIVAYDVPTFTQFRSSDSGKTWNTTTLPHGLGISAVHPDGSYFGTAVPLAIFRSTDFGETWITLQLPLGLSGSPSGMTFNSQGDVFVAVDGEAGGVLISTNKGVTWQVVNSGLTTRRTLPILHHPNGHLFVGTNGAGVFRTRVVPAEPHSPLKIDVQPQILAFGRLLSGSSDTLSVQIINSGDRDSLKLQSLVSTNDHFHAIIQTEVIPPYGIATMTVIYSPEIAGRDTGAILVTSNDPATPLFRLPVSGESFAITNEPTIAELASLDYNQVRIVWFRSILDSSSSPDPVAEYSIWRRIPGSQASGGAGMTLTTSTGWLFEFVLTVPAMTFERYAARVPKVWDNPWSVYIVAAHTIGGHVYRSSPDSILLFTPTGTGASLEIPVPNEPVLSQNYPNPFNPSTTIRYGLPRRSEVRLAVFSALGQQVALLVQGEQEAGYHEVRFNAEGLSSGVYFYRLQAGDYIATKRLLLLR